MAEHPVATGLRRLSEWLEREKQGGREYLSLSREAEEALRELPALCYAASLREMKKPAAATAAVVEEQGGLEKTTGSPQVAAAAPETKALASPGPADAERTESWARDQLNQIFRELKQDERCAELGTLRETLVFATGHPQADLMLVGEAPGAEEEKQRKPFVGPAGQKLTQILKAMGLSREEVYISNIVKYRPRKGDGRFQGNSNRPPDPHEVEACLPFLHREIDVVAPRVIVALGGSAAEGLLQVGGSVSRLRGEDHELRGIPVVVTYHPSYLLRQESEPDQAKAREAKRRVWEDMLRAMERAGLPISEKQRGFFQ